MRLYLCEKPSQGKDIAAVLGAKTRGDGCIKGNGVAVTWGIGHLLETAPPDAYGEHLKNWSLDTLPILPAEWKVLVKPKTASQFKIVKQLLKQATELVIATDADREGEMIARELIEYCGYRGPIQRLWLSALNEASIRQALNTVKQGSETYPLYLSALARSRADWLIGMNFSRLFTLLGRQAGYTGVLSVGRVQTPTLRLVVDRDREISNFIPKPFWGVEVQLWTAGQSFLGADGEMFNRTGTPWPEADLTIVDLATYAREGYNAQLSIAYISLINTVNNIAERDQYKGRPLVNVTDEGHIITKNPLLAPYIMKITKMWRKLGAWFWLATQNMDDFPPSTAPMLNMIEWWICLNMPPDEVEKISRFRELTPAQKGLMLSARKESGKYTEGVVLSKSMEVLFRAVPPSLYLALAMTEPEEKKQRYDLMQSMGVDELGAALEVAADLDRKRGIEPLNITFPTPRALENLA